MSKIDLVDINKKFTGNDNAEQSAASYINNPTAPINYFFPFFRKKNKKIHFSITNLNLKIPDGKTTVILGPSGCGKTTLLKMIAGLEKIDSGGIFFDDIDMTTSTPKDRNIGMVFQNYALFPHFSSKQNVISYYFFRKKTTEINREAEEKLKKTSEMLGVELEYLLDRNPGNLSGGEKQRVAIGRCITRNPSLFLMDEPFSNLDAKLREKYRIEVKRLLRSFKITSIYVTHDQHEALLLADFLVVMNEGKIVQSGTFEEIYNDPQNIFVAEFINPNSESTAINLIDGELVSGRMKDVLFGIRPGDIRIIDEKKEFSISGKIVDIWDIPIKKHSILDVQVGDKIVFVKEKLNSGLKKNQDIVLYPEKYYIFDRLTGNRVSKE